MREGQWSPSTAMREFRDGCARAAGVEPVRIVSHGRGADIMRLRHAVTFAVHRRFPRLSTIQIGVLMGGRDHSTIIHSLNKAEILRERCQVFHAMSEALALGLPVNRHLDVQPCGPIPPEPFRRKPAPTRAIRPKNDFADESGDHPRLAKGSAAMLAALRRAHPERAGTIIREGNLG